MKHLKTYKIFEANEKLKSRADLNKCWYNAKIGDKISEEYIYNYVQYLHDDYEGAFIDGDLGDRIEEFEIYKLTELSISQIDLDEFDINEDSVQEYKSIIKETGDYPPIVVDEDYRIIDGAHRAVAVSELQDKIKAWVGV
jgi:hypothetical protein